MIYVSFRATFCVLIAVTTSFVSSAMAELSEAAGKYYEMLRERPESEVIFDRFYDQWLGEASLEELEAMLVQATASKAAMVNDFRILAAFQEILRLTPGDREQREAYVDLLQRHGRLTDAIRELNKLCDTYPNDPELYLQRVELQGQTDDEAGLKQAIEVFAQSVGTEPEAQLRVARLYVGYDLLAEVGTIYAALAEAHPMDLEMVESYALWLYEQGDSRASEATLERLQTSAPTPAMNRFLEALPPASREIASILQNSHQIFRYQQPASHRGGRSMNMALQQFLYLPEDLTSLHRAAVLHLGALASAMEEVSREEAIVRMTSAGIPHAELFVAIEGASPANGNWLPPIMTPPS